LAIHNFFVGGVRCRCQKDAAAKIKRRLATESFVWELSRMDSLLDALYKLGWQDWATAVGVISA
jgi:hypothetical protein